MKETTIKSGSTALLKASLSQQRDLGQRLTLEGNQQTVKKDKNAKPMEKALLAVKLMSLITVPLAILLLLPSYPIFTNESESQDETFAASRRLLS